jgi:hypothetical protein
MAAFIAVYPTASQAITNEHTMVPTKNRISIVITIDTRPLRVRKIIGCKLSLRKDGIHYYVFMVLWNPGLIKHGSQENLYR